MKYRQLAEVLLSGQIVVAPTDTIYGILGLADSPKVVERIYKAKQRSSSKPLIILISDVGQLARFSIKLNQFQLQQIESKWPGPNSLIFTVNDEKFEYLHRGKQSLAFRLPNNSDLQSLINLTGPLVAPSANPQGLEPATTISKAREYFSETIDYYQEGPEIIGAASSLSIVGEKTMTKLR